MTVNFLLCLKSSVTEAPLLYQRLAKFSLCFSNHNLTTLCRNESFDSREERVMSLFYGCERLKHLEQLHAHIIRTGLEQSLFVMGKIIVFCAVSECARMDYALRVFGEIENPDGFLWNTVIRGLGRTRQPEKAFEFYKRMQVKGEVLDNFTYSFLVKICGQLGSVLLGKQIHCNVLKHGLEEHVFVRNTLVHMYGMFKDINTATHLFEEMPKSYVVTWNIIIECNVYCGRYKEAIDLFFRMLQCGVIPDDATFVVTLSACATLGELDIGRRVHSCIDHTGLGMDNVVSVSNSLIDMYAKCGVVEAAHRIFNEMKRRNIVSWNTMILALAMHGHGDEALGLFSKMLKEELATPDEVTFLGVLCACSHGGMVEEGRRFFDIMTRDFNIQPTIKHYGALVDILGRAGLVEEAYQLIKSMPIESNSIVWRTLLAACRVHGNLELAEQVRRHVSELEPDHSSDYVLLANMYASAGQWNEMARVRKSMHIRGVQKPKHMSFIAKE